jgi:glycosyltransferase involved in cell wall biosynthesis
VGDGPIRLKLEKEIKEKGLQDLVFFAGEQKEVISWLHAMDVFVLPSYANEGISQALIQAMMAAIPVVTTSAGAIEEVAFDCHTALVVEPNKSEPLRAAITSVLEDRALAENLATNARAFVLDNHTEAIMVRQMINVFENLVCT